MATEPQRPKPTSDAVPADRLEPRLETQTADAPAQADGDEDAQLMLAFQDGDESAFAALIERNQARVHAVAYRFLAGNGDVEDVVQEVFVRVFRSAQRYSPSAKFSTWLYRITANLCLNTLRKHGKRKMLRLAAPSEADGVVGTDVVDDRTPAPDAALGEAELAERIRQAIERLPDNQRLAIVLLRYEHMDYQQIADVLGCTTMAVKSLLSRARAHLRDALADDLAP
ncbi:MAG: sigma-70 family RNA polymerase sigma factor [Planctomycetes bacterium]|nr:sigma-70 family RNA polymerase sigma factor [Planctomycetota bacterium]